MGESEAFSAQSGSMVAITPAMGPAAYVKKVPVGSYLHVDNLPGTRSAARSAVSRAVARGEIVSLRRGLYFKGEPGRYGMVKPPAEDIALEVMGHKGVGPCGVSAARAFGLTTQMPPEPELATAGPIPKGLAGVRIHKRSNSARRDLSYFEVAALELLRDFEYTAEAGWAAVVKAIVDKIQDHDIRPGILADVASQEHDRRVSERLALVLVVAESSTEPR